MLTESDLKFEDAHWGLATIIFIHDLNVSHMMKWIITNVQYKEQHTKTWSIIKSLSPEAKINMDREAHIAINRHNTTNSILNFFPVLFLNNKIYSL
jgi:hypothetical protein